MRVRAHWDHAQIRRLTLEIVWDYQRVLLPLNKTAIQAASEEFGTGSDAMETLIGICRHARGFLKRHFKTGLAFASDIITVAVFLWPLGGLQMIITHFHSARVAVSADVADAIDGICSRSVLVKTLEDGSFHTKGVEYALSLKARCKIQLTQEFRVRRLKDA